jgi:(1->4)-alpha-D-glucan 1-alpha-D-glucosylmutase
MRNGLFRAVPSSTYRLQLHRHFTVQEAINVVPYLCDLGIGCVYLSPILKARPGSPHGYDVVDPDYLNPELGTPEQFRSLGDALRACGMGMIVDIVPNHMCIADPGNWRWMDVLENGPSSPYAQFFDIDWRPPREDLKDKVLIPILGEQYGRVLENGDLRLEYSDGAFKVRYGDKVFPIAPRTWLRILEPVAESLRRRVGEGNAAATELDSILTALSYLPLRSETDERRIRERLREKEVIKSRLARLVDGSPECRDVLFERIHQMNGRKGRVSSFDDLEQLLADQAYRLSYWRVAADEINYRRFFDVDELASIRVEEPAVFDAVHARIFDGIREGWITGVRVDHPDGLYDPVRYFRQLQRAAERAVRPDDIPANEPSTPLFYVVAEKIMASEERPRKDWAVDGTTGYGFLNEVNGLFVDPAARDTIHAAYEDFTKQLVPFSDLVYECKRLILRVSLSSDLNVLSRHLDRICQQHRHTRDFTLDSLRFALREVIACFPVYRTYVSETSSEVDEEDRRHILLAVDNAKARNPATSESIFDSIASILLLEDPPSLSREQKTERRLFVMRFQQLTGPVMAKGVEDTAFYRQFPLASLNEVGGDPQAFGLDVKTFHAKIAERFSYWPHSLLATSTHDTKRSEDVRARLNVLSEIPEEWAEAVRRWSAMNEPFRTMIDRSPTPDREAEYLLYQTLLGAWPLHGLPDAPQHTEFVNRIQDYMQKALHEAKVRTSWINPNTAYDGAVRGFVARVLRRAPDNMFLSDIENFSAGISGPGLWNSLAQTVLKLTCPGVPDIYQGNELWDFSLVDPDNRRPVDYVHRRRLLAELPIKSEEGRDAWLVEAARNLTDGRLKLFITSVIGRFRREHTNVFEQGTYISLEAAGELRDHVVSFARSIEGQTIVVAVGRLFVKLSCRATLPIGADVWGDLRIDLRGLPSGPYRDLLSGMVINAEAFLPARQIFSFLPVSVLVSRPFGTPGASTALVH